MKHSHIVLFSCRGPIDIIQTYTFTFLLKIFDFDCMVHLESVLCMTINTLSLKERKINFHVFKTASFLEIMP